MTRAVPWRPGLLGVSFLSGEDARGLCGLLTLDANWQAWLHSGLCRHVPAMTEISTGRVGCCWISLVRGVVLVGLDEASILLLLLLSCMKYPRQVTVECGKYFWSIVVVVVDGEFLDLISHASVSAD